MPEISRREFIKNAATSAAAARFAFCGALELAPILLACPSAARLAGQGNDCQGFPAPLSSLPPPDFRPLSCARP